MTRHACGDWCDCPGFPLEVQASDETDTLSQSDRKIQHAVRDLERAVEDGRFEIETPRVNLTQDDIDAFSVGWSRDTKFTRSHTRSPGPMQLDVEFDKGVENEILYRDLESDMETVAPRVVLYGDMHLWYGETAYHRVSVDVTIGHVEGIPPMSLDARLHWLNVETAGWR